MRPSSAWDLQPDAGAQSRGGRSGGGGSGSHAGGGSRGASAWAAPCRARGGGRRRRPGTTASPTIRAVTTTRGVTTIRAATGSHGRGRAAPLLLLSVLRLRLRLRRYGLSIGFSFGYPYAYGYPYYGYRYGYPYHGYPYGAYGFSYGEATIRPATALASRTAAFAFRAPCAMQVFVDGSYAGIVDDFDGSFQRLDLEGGAHSIEIRGPGVPPLTYDVNVQPGHNVTLHANAR
mgnify:CR=1 FL=1